MTHPQVFGQKLTPIRRFSATPSQPRQPRRIRLFSVVTKNWHRLRNFTDLFRLDSVKISFYEVATAPIPVH